VDRRREEGGQRRWGRPLKSVKPLVRKVKVNVKVWVLAIWLLTRVDS